MISVQCTWRGQGIQHLKIRTYTFNAESKMWLFGLMVLLCLICSEYPQVLFWPICVEYLQVLLCSMCPDCHCLQVIQSANMLVLLCTIEAKYSKCYQLNA